MAIFFALNYVFAVIKNFYYPLKYNCTNENIFKYSVNNWKFTKFIYLYMYKYINAGTKIIFREGYTDLTNFDDYLKGWTFYEIKKCTSAN